MVIIVDFRFKVGGIRLGEHNTETNPDCDREYCAELVQDFKPELIISHKDYNKTPFKNDIALIRLNEPAQMNGKFDYFCNYTRLALRQRR